MAFLARQAFRLHHHAFSFLRSPQYAKLTRTSHSLVDIHSIGPTDPKSYDVLITDLDNNLLSSAISKRAGIKHLQLASTEEAKKVTQTAYGFTYGRNFRQILPCVISTDSTARWVHFLVDTGAPLTYISGYVAKAFGFNVDTDFPGPWNMKIAGYHHSVHLSPPDAHFAEISILGNDFCTINHVRPWVHNAETRDVTFFFGEDWEVVSRKKP